MEPISAKDQFEAFLLASNITLASLTPRMGLDLMVRFHEEDPDQGCLAWSWNAVTRYGSDEFGFNITYWPIPADDHPVDDDPFDLKFKVGPLPVAGDFPNSGLVWITDSWREILRNYPQWLRWGGSSVSGVALVSWDRDTHDAVFDCWGARDPEQPILTMTEQEWLQSDDVLRMIIWFRQQWAGDEIELDRLLHRFGVASCRRIWRLLPHEATRAGVEAAERYLDGLATREELHRAEWHAEGAAFFIDSGAEAVRSEDEAATIAKWVDEIGQIPTEELATLITKRSAEALSPYELLSRAAYFADGCLTNTWDRPKRMGTARDRLFLSAPLLREIVGNPFDGTPGRNPDF